MTATRQPLRDGHGRAMFSCTECRAPLTSDDLFDLGLRMPEPDEDRDEYCDSQLIDALSHTDCLRARRAG